jgi:signal transduction histidine kinase/DNA-binding NarL/FixJ family response regulator
MKYYFLLFIIIFLISCYTDTNQYKPEAVNGILDLSEWDFEKNGIIDLRGEWEFYWNRFFSPEDFCKEVLPEKSGVINVPGIWNDFKIDGNKIGAEGFATYRLVIKLRTTEKYLAIKLFQISSAYNLFINGNKIISLGEIGISKSLMIPVRTPITEMVEVNSDRLEIIIQVSNFHDKNSGFYYHAPYIGYEYQINEKKEQDIIFQVFLFGSILIISFYHLCLFLLYKKDISALFFSALCFCLSIRQVFTGNVLLINIMFNVPWAIIQKIDYLSFYLAAPFFLLFIYYIFKDIQSRIPVSVFLVLISIHVLIVLFGSPMIISYTLISYHIITLLVIAYIIIILIHGLFYSDDAALILGGFLIVALTVINDLLYSSQLIHTMYLAPFGILVFIIIQSILLSIRFSNAYYQVERYSKKLEEYTDRLEKKVKERTLQLKKATDAKSDFFVNLTHEIRTPLTLINNHLEKYIEEKGENEVSDILRKNFIKLKTDMNNFFDYEKLSRGIITYNNDQIVNCSDILEEIIKLFSQTAGIKKIIIKKEIKENLYLKLDPIALERIIMNLLDNAIKYTEPGGFVTVKLDSINTYVQLKVTDTGIGISKKDMENIFKPYYQIIHKKRNIQGMGMGLNIVKKILDESGGRIEIESEPGKGSSFMIKFKKYAISEDDKISGFNLSEKSVQLFRDAVPGKEVYLPGRYNILLVEDNPDMLAFIHGALKKLYNVYYTKNGREAMDRIQYIPLPDLIISDIMMDEMDGYEFCSSLSEHEKYNTIPFIFLTAKTSSEDRLKGLVSGAVDFIMKPFDIEVLLAKIESLFKTFESQKMKSRIEMEERILKTIRPDAFEKSEYADFEKKCETYNISEREKEIIQLILKGITNKEISSKLYISYPTVMTHLKHIYTKCGINNRYKIVNLFKS